jgi:hypothetical protein
VESISGVKSRRSRGDARTALQLFGAAERLFVDFDLRWSPTSFWRRWINRY